MRHLSSRRTVPAALISMVLLSACGGASPAGSVACTEAVDGVVTITAAELAFDTSCLVVPAGDPFTIVLVNDEDSEPHNVAIYTDSSRGTQLYAGEIINGGETIEYDVEALEPGTFYFDCTVHPGMNGSVIAE